MNLHQEMTFRFTLLRATAFCLAAVGTVAMAQTAGDNPSPTQRETFSLDQGWRFHLGDIPITAFIGSQDLSFGPPDITNSGSKAGATWGAAASKFDDSNWRQLDLPHDWVVELPYDAKAIKAQGYRQRGIAWYRRQFKLDPIR